MSPSYRIVFYISGHGFGHVSRMLPVIDAVAARCPDVAISVRTAVPRWVFTQTRVAIDYVEVQADTGIVQIDSLHPDETESVTQAAAFHAALDDKAAAEAVELTTMGASLVIGDIPPLAFAAAAAAGVPSVAIGNFTWDWIYEGYPGAGDWIEPLRRAYGQATRALRLPMGGGFEGLEAVTRDIPWIARLSTRDRDELRRAFQLPRDKPVVLMSFGGYGLAGIDLDAIDVRTDCTIINDPVADLLRESGCSYPDLVHAADVVVTKPGYGILSECIANGTAMLYTSRGRFREYDVMVREMPQCLRAQFIPQEDLLAGHWREPLERLLASPPPPTTPAVNGADIAAEIIINELNA